MAGRGPLFDAFEDALGSLHRGEPARPFAWLGRVGSGRTAALHDAARRAAALGWAAAVVGLDQHTPIEHEVARGVAAAVLHLGRRHPDEPKLVELLGAARAYGDAHGLDLPIDAPVPEISWPGNRRSDAGALFERVADGLRTIGSGLFLAMDDVDRVTAEERGDVLSAVAQLSGAGRAVHVVMAGLPGSVSSAFADPAELGALAPAEVFEALAAPASEHGVTVRPETVVAIGRRTDGHPYFVQAFARAAWMHAGDGQITPDDVSDVALTVERELRSSFFAPALDGLSATELRFVRAVGDAGEAEDFPAIARRLGDAVRFDPATSRLAPIRDGLLERGVLYADDEHRLRFALPYFERYIRSTD